MKDFLEKRVDQKIVISDIDEYLEGLLDISSFLCSELYTFLKEEGRYLGITISYMKSINDSYNKINKNVTESDIVSYGKLLYLYKPLLRREFKRLKSKKLSSGDSVIVMLNKILDIISTEKTQKFKYSKELRTIRKIISKFFDNIRNNKKNDSMFGLGNEIKSLINEGKTGKYPLDQFSFNENRDLEKSELQSPEERVQEETNNKINEIDL